MQQMFRRSTDQHGVPCTALIPLCAPYLSLCVHRTYPSVCTVLIPLYAPRLSLCVHHTLTLFLKVRRLVKRHNPWIVAFTKIAAAFRRLVKRHNPWIVAFTKIAAAFPVKMRCVAPNCGTFGKRRRNTLPAQIQRQTI